VEVRVGDYHFDNTNYFGAGFLPAQFVGIDRMPLDNDYQEFRRHLWLATDKAYKQALEALSQKRAALETRSRGDNLDDFSREPVTTTADELGETPANRPMMEALVRDLSATFRGNSEIYSSSAAVNVSWSRTVYLNSEGTSFTLARPRAGVSVQASTQATDGTNLSTTYSASANSLAELPSRDSLLRAAHDVAARLVEQRHMPLADAYDGPVLFEGAAAAELFNTMIVPKLVGARRPVTAPQFAAMMGQGNDWEDLIGSLVLPRWLTVVDDPTLTTLGGQPLEGRRVDDDGVATHPTTLVDHGILKTLLTGRTPVAGVDHSTGNRFSGGARPLHVVVTADSALTADEMHRRLIALAAAQGRPYGVVVRQLAGGAAGGGGSEEIAFMMLGQQGGRAPAVRGMRAAKLYADGHEEPMRGAEVNGLSAASFKEMTAASLPATVHSLVFGAGFNPFTGTTGTGAVAYSVPSFLFSNLSIRKPRGSTPTLPVVAPPRQ
jgi:hypothetical protein